MIYLPCENTVARGVPHTGCVVGHVVVCHLAVDGLSLTQSAAGRLRTTPAANYVSGRWSVATWVRGRPPATNWVCGRSPPAVFSYGKRIIFAILFLGDYFCYFN